MTAALLRLNLRQVRASEEACASALSPLRASASGSKGASETKRSSRGGGSTATGLPDMSFILGPSRGAPGEADARIERREREVGDQHADYGEHGDEHQDEACEIL